MADWATLLLEKIGAPQSATNLQALALWAQSEGVAPAANNPLAATDTAPGSRPYPPSPTVQQYVSADQAATVYAGKLETGTYAAIGFALIHDQGLAAIYQAVNQSPWCAGCQGGNYPTALHAAIGGTAPPPGSGSLTVGPSYAPPKWSPATAASAAGSPQPAGTSPSLQALGGFGAAIGYWLPYHLNRARDSARMLAKIVS